MAPSVATSVPALHTAGDSLALRFVDLEKPAADGWVPAIVLVHASGRIAITGAVDAGEYVVSATAATTAAWAPGLYNINVQLTRTGERSTIHTQYITILPDPATAAPFDARSHARRTLDALEAWIEGHDMAVASYRIGDRQMQYIEIEQLLKLRDIYRSEVRRETAAAAGRFYNKLQVRL